MEGTLHGRVGLVTGAAAGIGRSIAVGLARRGAHVMISDIDAEGGHDTVRSILDAGGHAVFHACDTTDPTECETLVDATLGAFGAVHMVANSLGAGSHAALTADFPPEEWREVISTHLDAVFYCMRAQIPAIIRSGGGAIVNIASVLGLVAWPQAPAYVAAKHGVIGLTKAAAVEYAPRGVRVNAVAPGILETSLLTEAGVTAGSEIQAFVTEKHAAGRLGTPEEIAEAAIWLLSDGASFTTGATLPVDGGFTAL